MEIFHLNSYDEIYNAYISVKDTFPNLEKRVNIDEYLNKLFKYANVFAVKTDGKICAFAAMYANNQETKTAFITLIGIDIALKRRGIGTKLFEFLVGFAKQNTMNALLLEVDKNNVGAIEFYKKQGMKIESEASSKSYYMKKFLK